MLDEPRLLLLRAELPLIDRPELPLLADEPLRLLPPRLLLSLLPPRFPLLPKLPESRPPPRSMVPADCRPPFRACCWRAFVCLEESESPRAVPPNLFAVPRSP